MYHTRLTVVCDPQFSEILIAEIGEAGFDAFLENENGFEAYAEVDRFNQLKVDEIKAKYKAVEPLEFSYDRVEKRNWNEEWEKATSLLSLTIAVSFAQSFIIFKSRFPTLLPSRQKCPLAPGIIKQRT